MVVWHFIGVTNAKKLYPFRKKVKIVVSFVNTQTQLAPLGTKNNIQKKRL